MFKIVVLLTLAVSVSCAEISHMTLDRQAIMPAIEADAVETHGILKKQTPSQEAHPVYIADKHNEGRATIEPVRIPSNVVKHDMLADQPPQSSPNDVTRIDNLEIPHYGFSNPVEVAYPDIPYAPGYSYGTGYGSPDRYDVYATNPTDYLVEPDTSVLGLLWSQVPDARTMVNATGRTIGWILNSIFVIMVGSILTVGFCTYTNLCKITFNGVGPIHEEMRSLITPERLERISHAADFVKTAIDKYQKIQEVKVGDGLRKKRSIFY